MDQSIVSFVGIDVAKDALDVHVGHNGSRLSISNEADSILKPARGGGMCYSHMTSLGVR